MLKTNEAFLKLNNGVLGLECRQETAGEELYGWAEIIMTIFNEETFSLKSGLQKGPRKLKIKNLQWIKMLKDATKN